MNQREKELSDLQRRVSALEKLVMPSTSSELRYGQDSRQPRSVNFTASGTYTKPRGVVSIRVRVQAAGGGGGGADVVTNGDQSAAGGGGAGEYAEGFFDVADVPASVTITVGAAGAAGTSSGGNGGTGGNSSFGSLISATGGSGGGGVANGEQESAGQVGGGAGGTGGSGGSLRIPGNPGQPGLALHHALELGSTLSVGGSGGASMLGPGGISRSASDGAGNAPSGGYGGGGGGATENDTVGQAGGDGAPGIVIIEEFYK